MKLQVQEDLAATLLNRLHRPRALGCKELDPHLEQRDRGAKLVHELCGSDKVLDIQGHDQSRRLSHRMTPLRLDREAHQVLRQDQLAVKDLPARGDDVILVADRIEVRQDKSPTP
ncbi:MAG: hypothetical protein HW385_1592 [candidate division NC10 bacterium]|nr:hypothetical protein [candidate division NC10 bacterium]